MKRQDNPCRRSGRRCHLLSLLSPDVILNLAGASLAAFSAVNSRDDLFDPAPATHGNKCTIWRLTLKPFSASYWLDGWQALRGIRQENRHCLAKMVHGEAAARAPELAWKIPCCLRLALPCLRYYYSLRREEPSTLRKFSPYFSTVSLPAFLHPHHHFQPTHQSSSTQHPPRSWSVQHALPNIDTKTSIQNLLPLSTPDLTASLATDKSSSIVYAFAPPKRLRNPSAAEAANISHLAKAL